MLSILRTIWTVLLHTFRRRETVQYPEQAIYLDQYVVVEADGTLSVYRNWFQDYTRETITAELEAGGFAVQDVWNDLTGTPYAEGGEWIGVVALRSG